MPLFAYNIVLFLYRLGIGIASVWNVKARKWVAGRKGLFQQITSSIANDKSRIAWFHCSSLGEFEQGRPIIESIRTRFPHLKLAITFFSPSGYEVRKNYAHADYIFYLPFDSKKNAQLFLDLLNPSLVVFIKYEYWYYYLIEIKKRNINCLLASAVFREEQSFFKWYGSLQRKMLRCFTQIFVQDIESKKLLNSINLENVIVSGDTRFDSVIEVAETFEPIPLIEAFIHESKCIVAGSTWTADETWLHKVYARLNGQQLKLIIAPHEIDETRLKELRAFFPRSIRLSELKGESHQIQSDTLIIDNIGMLSRLYYYAFITYVGGGFTSDGVHNVLEAAVFGKPVVFGKNYAKYKEAVDLVQVKAADSFSNVDELFEIIKLLLNNEKEYMQRCQASLTYVRNNKGATEKILYYIAENRLLTN